MDVEITARFRAPGDIPALRQVGQATLCTKDGTRSYEFRQIFRESDNTRHIYDKLLEPLLNDFLQGFNCCFLCWKGSDPSQNYQTLSEDIDEDKALFSVIFKDLFIKLDRQSKNKNIKPLVTLEMYELYKHQVNDLLEIRDGNKSGKPKQDLSQVRRLPIKTSEGTVAMLNQTTSNRRFNGLNKAASVSLLELESIHDNVLLSTKSLFAVVEICLDHIDHTVTTETLSDSILSALELTSQDARQDKTNYGISQFVNLLPTVLGGNCCTSTLIHFKPQQSQESIGTMLSVAKVMSNVKNYPIINSTFAEILLTKYKSRIDALREQNKRLATSLREMTDSGAAGTQKVQTKGREKVPLNVKSLQDKLKVMAERETDLSSKLVTAEEEKLALSKDLVETKIANTRLTEEAENTKFELTNRCLVLENEIMQSSTETDQVQKNLQELKDRVARLKFEKQELMESQKKLKNMYMRVLRESEVEVETAHSAEQEKLEIEKRLFGTTYQFDKELQKMRSDYVIEQRELESLVKTLRNDLDRAREAVKTSQLRIAQQSTKLVQLTNKSHDLSLQNDSLQYKLKSLNEEYRSKLSKYISDVAKYVESKLTSQQDVNCLMAKQVDQGLQDLKTAFTTREEQLSRAAVMYKSQSQKVAARHEELLVAYRYLREQVTFRQIIGLDLGQDEYNLSLQLPELESANRKEISRLQEELEKVRAMATVPLPPMESIKKTDESRWSDLRIQLREFTLNTQQSLEAERATLLSRCYIAEEQLEECHRYIERYLNRYKTENIHLRKLLGLENVDDLINSELAARKDRRGKVKHKTDAFPWFLP